MQRQAKANVVVPRIGDRVERVRAGVSKRGKVHYADELQALVKWDDGSSSSIRLDKERLKVIEPRRAPARTETPRAEALQASQLRLGLSRFDRATNDRTASRSFSSPRPLVDLCGRRREAC